jgi:hypothetical protein
MAFQDLEIARVLDPGIPGAVVGVVRIMASS